MKYMALIHADPATTTIRAGNGKTETMDGPFAETKAQLAGFCIPDRADLDDAVRYAALVRGASEIRPIRVFDR